MNISMTQKPLNEKQRQFLSQLIEDKINRLTQKILISSQTLDQQISPATDEVDTANDNIILSTQLRFTSRESRYLKKLKKAQARLLRNDYGTCEDCGVDIGFQRLKARPTSELCIDCKEESEREESLSAKSLNQKIIGKILSYEVPI